MAEVADATRQHKKVNCRSRLAGTALVHKINDCAFSTIDQLKYLPKGSKQKCKERFKEIFETAFQQNVVVDGQDWSTIDGDSSEDKEEDITTEFEPLDMEKKKYINDELMSSLNETIVKTTRNRRHIGQKYKSQLKKLAASETHYLGRVSVQWEKSDTDSCLDQPVHQINERVCDRLRSAESNLSQLTKHSTVQVQKLDNIVKAKESLKDSKRSRTDRVLFRPLADEGKMAESVTPLKRKFHSPEPTTPAKRRFSKRQDHLNHRNLRTRLKS